MEEPAADHLRGCGGAKALGDVAIVGDGESDRHSRNFKKLK